MSKSKIKVSLNIGLVHFPVLTQGVIGELVIGELLNMGRPFSISKIVKSLSARSHMRNVGFLSLMHPYCELGMHAKN